MKITSIILITTVTATIGIFQAYYQSEYLQNAYDAYFNNNFEKTIENIEYLEDSLDFQHDGLILNKAHAYYKLHNFNGTVTPPNADDSLSIQIVQTAMYNYAKAFGLNRELASIAYNQTGNLIFKTGVINQQKVGLEQLLTTSIEYYKNALLADPGNEAARYNYELLKKYSAFPDQLFKIVESLVAQRKFNEAYQLLAPWAQADKRFEKKKDYAKRLGEIVQIENMVNPNE